MINIDKEKCTGCLTCLSICPFTVLEEVDGKPQMAEGKGCLRCMHCAAACPEKAISWKDTPGILEKAMPELRPGFSEELKEHILMRRSYRHFRQEKVPHHIIEEALQLAAWAPSAKNQHSTKWLIIDSQETIKRIMELILKHVEESGASPEIASEFAIGNNVVMGTAPTLLLAYASDLAISPETDTAIAMATAELYLQSRGIGTCWAGYLKRMCNGIPEIKELLPKLPRKHSFYGAFMMGYPENETYLHIPRRFKETDIKWV